MYVIPDLINLCSKNNFGNKSIEHNLYSLIDKYKSKIENLRSAHEKVGLVCQNIVTVSLFEKEIDFLIFPASVLQSQVHREYGSTFQKEILLEVRNYENVKHAKDFTLAASVSHTFIGIDHTGIVCQRTSTGNNNINLLISDFFGVDNKYIIEYKNLYINDKNFKYDDGYILKIFKINF
jgi:hypothetical protein